MTYWIFSKKVNPYILGGFDFYLSYITMFYFISNYPRLYQTKTVFLYGFQMVPSFKRVWALAILAESRCSLHTINLLSERHTGNICHVQNTKVDAGVIEKNDLDPASKNLVSGRQKETYNQIGVGTS